MQIIKKFIFILIFILFGFQANAACKFDLKFGDDAKKVLEKYGPPMPSIHEGISIIPVSADDVCPNEKLKDISVEYRFLDNKDGASELAAINLVALNDENNSVSEKFTLMNYAKKVYGKFDTGHNPSAYIGYEVFEKSNYYAVYQRVYEEDKMINEQIYISNKKYDKLLEEFYKKMEEQSETGSSNN